MADSSNAMAISPGGNTVALASPYGGHVTLWDLASNKQIDQFGVVDRGIWVVHPLLAFSPDGSVVAYSGGLAYTNALATSRNQEDAAATRVRLRNLQTKEAWELEAD